MYVKFTSNLQYNKIILYALNNNCLTIVITIVNNKIMGQFNIDVL